MEGEIRQMLRYPVVFAIEGETPRPGSLELAGNVVVLAGGAGDEALELRISIADVTRVRTSRTPRERLSGYPVLVIERAEGAPVLVAPLGAGLLTELADLLASLPSGSGPHERIAVVLPLKANALPRARELVDRGPPFDPGSLAGIEHAVYLDGQTVVFLFEGPGARRDVERLMRRPGLWRAGLAWRQWAAGRPYATDSTTVPSEDAELVFSWPSSD